MRNGTNYYVSQNVTLAAELCYCLGNTHVKCFAAL